MVALPCQLQWVRLIVPCPRCRCAPSNVGGLWGVKKEVGGVHSSRAVFFSSKNNKLDVIICLVSGGAKGLASHVLWDSCVQHQTLKPQMQCGALVALVFLCRAKRLQVLSCGLMRGIRHMGEFTFSAFHWLVKRWCFTQHDFEGNTAWGASCTEQSLRSRTCSSSMVLAPANRVNWYGRSWGDGCHWFSLMPEENRNMSVNSHSARHSRITSSLQRTQKTARRWRVDALVNREVCVHLGLLSCL